MSQFIEKIQQHPFNNSVDIFKSSISDIETIDNLSIDEAEIINRIKSVILFSENRLLSTDPYLIPLNSLAAINNALISINTEIGHFKANRNIAHLNNANNYIDNILIHISNVCTPISANELENVRESIITFRKSIGQQLRHAEGDYQKLNSEATILKKNIELINNTLEDQKKVIRQNVEKYDSDYKNSEKERTNIFQNYITAAKNELDIELQKLNVQFKEFSDKMNDVFNSTKNNYKSEVDAFIGSLQALKKQAENIVGVIGNTGVVGGFQQFANKERRSAFWWKIIASASFIGLITFGILSFKLTVGSEFNWGVLGARLFAASTFGILAAYAARLADKHDFSEKLNRKMELELASIDPYIVNLPEQLKNDIKKQLSEKLFGQYDLLKTNKEGKVTKSSVGLIQTTLETLKEAISKIK